MTTRQQKRGGKRIGAGRKPGVPNRSTRHLKEIANEFTEEALETIVLVMRDLEAPPAVRLQAADRLLDRSHGRPSLHIEKTEIDASSIPWAELRELSRRSVEKALAHHKEFIEGRYERLGLTKDYDDN